MLNRKNMKKLHLLLFILLGSIMAHTTIKNPIITTPPSPPPADWAINGAFSDLPSPDYGCPTFPVCIKNNFDCDISFNFTIKTLVNGIITTTTVTKTIPACTEFCFERSMFSDPNILDAYSGHWALSPSSDYQMDFLFSINQIPEQPLPFTTTVLGDHNLCGNDCGVKIVTNSFCPSLRMSINPSTHGCDGGC